MLKKAKSEQAGKQSSKRKDKDSAQAVLDSSRQIWLAGLGAFSRAQAEGMKVFEALVKQGEVLETKTRRVAVDKAAMAQVAAKAKVKEVQKGVGGTWDKLEQVFEHRVARALAKLGVYTQTDMERLTERVDVLSEAVNELIKATGVKPKRRPAPPEGAVERMVKGAVSSAAKTASGAVSSATGAVSSVTRTARKTVRTATKIARASLK
jgi:poly(hydroxyalkanoate) granule-associated protein